MPLDFSFRDLEKEPFPLPRAESDPSPSGEGDLEEAVEVPCNEDLCPVSKDPFRHLLEEQEALIRYRDLSLSAHLCPEKGTIPYDRRGDRFHKEANDWGAEKGAKEGVAVVERDEIPVGQKDSVMGSGKDIFLSNFTAERHHTRQGEIVVPFKENDGGFPAEFLKGFEYRCVDLDRSLLPSYEKFEKITRENEEIATIPLLPQEC
jgi:hypothetical protein